MSDKEIDWSDLPEWTDCPHRETLPSCFNVKIRPHDGRLLILDFENMKYVPLIIKPSGVERWQLEQALHTLNQLRAEKGLEFAA